MRIWSIHPKYLDSKGLLAVWRETLLAKQVLEGKTKGYKNHPQLIRFKQTKKPIDSINQYLYAIYEEAKSRNYNFSKDKISNYEETTISVTDKQVEYELKHLKNKLKIRDQSKLKEIENIRSIELHPMFIQVSGEIETWEKIK